MHAYCSDGRFVVEGLPFEYKERIKECGFHWSKAQRAWICPENLISAYALVSSALPHDDVEEIKGWIQRAVDVPEHDWKGFKFTPMPHQKKGAGLVLARKRFGLFFDMATGKTLTALMVARELYEQGKITRALIICPTSLFSTWKGEIEKHIGKHPFIVLWGTKKKRYKALEAWKNSDPKKLTFGVTSWDTLPRIWTDIALPYPPNYVIGDESSFIKNRKAQRSKAAIAIADKATYVTALTGTPYVSDVSDLWSQMRFLSHEYAGMSFWRFANRYIEFDNSPWHRPRGIRREMEGELKDLISSVSMHVSKEDVLELPEKILQERVISPGPSQRKVLKVAMKEFYFAVEAVKKGKKNAEAQKVLIRNALARINKVQQIAGGWTKNEDGEIIRFKDNPKRDALLDVFNEVGDRRVVIFSRFIEDLEIASEAAASVGRKPVLYHGQMPEAKAEASKQEFMKGDADTFVSQVQKGGFGIDLTRATVCIFVSNWWSVGVRRQAEDRLHRPGQESRVLYVDLILEESVDEHITGAIKQNRSITEYLFGRAMEKEEEKCQSA